MFRVDSRPFFLSNSFARSCRPWAVKVDEKDKRLQVALVYDFQGGLLHSLQHGAMMGRGGLCLSAFQQAATSGEDRAVKVWCTESGELLWRLAPEKQRSPSVRFHQRQLVVSGTAEVSIYGALGQLERRLEIEPLGQGSPKLELRSTPLTYPRLALNGSYVVSAHEARVATVWTLRDGRPLCSLSDERRITGDFYTALAGEQLVVIAGKMSLGAI